MLHLATFTSLLQFFFAPKGSPWWAGAVWGNVVAIVPCGIVGAIWVKLKLFPLNIIHDRLEALHTKHDALHEKHDALHAHVLRLHDSHIEIHEKLDALASGPGGGPSKPADGGSTPS